MITDIYAASEEPISEIDGRRLAEAIGEAGHPAISYGGSLDDIERGWPDRFEQGELVLTLGAGDISALGPKLLAAIDARAGGDS